MEAYSKMSDEDKALLISTINGKNTDRTEALLENQSKTLGEIQDHLRRHNSWLADFGANIAGNAAYDGALWILKALFRR